MIPNVRFGSAHNVNNAVDQISVRFPQSCCLVMYRILIRIRGISLVVEISMPHPLINIYSRKISRSREYNDYSYGCAYWRKQGIIVSQQKHRIAQRMVFFNMNNFVFLLLRVCMFCLVVLLLVMFKQLFDVLRSILSLRNFIETLASVRNQLPRAICQRTLALRLICRVIITSRVIFEYTYVP